MAIKPGTMLSYGRGFSTQMLKLSPTSCYNYASDDFTFSIFLKKLCDILRSSHSEVFCMKGVPKNFVKLTGKHLCFQTF